MTLPSRAVAVLLASCLLSACQSPQLVLSQDLQHDVQTMDVSGRMGLIGGRTLRFGDFTTSELKQSWPTMTRVNFIVKFERAKQKLSFTQFGPGGRSSQVLAVGRFSNTEVSLLNGHLNYSPEYQNAFSGTVVPDDGTAPWEFLVDEPEGGTFEPINGAARSQDGRQHLSIEPVRRIAGQASFMPAIDNWGFEFRHDGRVVGAVSVMNSGRVWMRQDASPEIRQVVAAISSALLLRQSLRDWGG